MKGSNINGAVKRHNAVLIETTLICHTEYISSPMKRRRLLFCLTNGKNATAVQNVMLEQIV